MKFLRFRNSYTFLSLFTDCTHRNLPVFRNVYCAIPLQSLQKHSIRFLDVNTNFVVVCEASPSFVYDIFFFARNKSLLFLDFVLPN